MLEIKNLHVNVADKAILKGIDLTVKPGEVHAIMGPNGSGKSTLGSVLAGRDGYEVTEGRCRIDGKDLLELDPEERAREGVFLAFQYPVEIPGVSNTYFLQAGAQRRSASTAASRSSTPMQFLKLVRGEDRSCSHRRRPAEPAVNEGFSGGEKKRNEIFQMAVLDPKLAILDETDSGLDIDALRIVADGVNALRSPDRAILVDHPLPAAARTTSCRTSVHVLADGRIVRSGGKELALELEEKGYGRARQWLRRPESMAHWKRHDARPAYRTTRPDSASRLAPADAAAGCAASREAGLAPLRASWASPARATRSGATPTCVRWRRSTFDAGCRDGGDGRDRPLPRR